MKYELMCLSLAQKEVGAKKVFKGVQDLLKQFKAEDIKEDYWGKRDLAYDIKSSSSGFYTVFTYVLDPKNSPLLSKELNLNEDICRYIISKIDK